MTQLWFRKVIVLPKVLDTEWQSQHLKVKLIGTPVFLTPGLPAWGPEIIPGNEFTRGDFLLVGGLGSIPMYLH